MAMLLVSGIAGCSATDNTHIAQADLMRLLETGHAPVIIDVRSESEYRTGHVPEAIHIPFWSALTTDRLEAYPASELLVLYCEHGPRAGFAKMAFYVAGFENIRYLQGHMRSWKDAQLPIETTTRE